MRARARVSLSFLLLFWNNNNNNICKHAILHRVALSSRRELSSRDEVASGWKFAREKGRNDSFLSVLTIACRHQLVGASSRLVTHAIRRRDTAESARGTIRRCLVPAPLFLEISNERKSREVYFLYEEFFQTRTSRRSSVQMSKERKRSEIRGYSNLSCT